MSCAAVKRLVRPMSEEPLFKPVTDPHPIASGPTLTAAEYRVLTLLLYLDGRPLCEARPPRPSTAMLRDMIERGYVAVTALSPACYRVTGRGQAVRVNGVIT